MVLGYLPAASNLTPLVDNENRFWTEAPTQEYFAHLEQMYRDGGIDVPL